MDNATIDGVELAYRVAGSPDGTPIVLIHGYTGNTRNWALSIKPLTGAGWRTLSADNPGHGSSSSPADPQRYGMAAMADLHHKLAASLGFEPAVIMGHSMGGAIAEEYTIRHPEAVRALILVDSAGGGPRNDPMMLQMQKSMEKARQIVSEEGMGALWDYQVANGLRPAMDVLAPEMRDFLRAEFCLTSAAGYLNCAEGMRDRRDTLPELAALAKPALVMRGENESAGLTQAADGLAAAIPGARYEIIPNSAHSPQMENADRFNEVLLSFLSDLK